MEKFVPALPAKNNRGVSCGCYALAIINQMTCDEANEGVRLSLRRKRRVQGMYEWEMERFSRGKYFRRPLKLVTVKERPTLRTLADCLKCSMHDFEAIHEALGYARRTSETVKVPRKALVNLLIDHAKMIDILEGQT